MQRLSTELQAKEVEQLSDEELKNRFDDARG